MVLVIVLLIIAALVAGIWLYVEWGVHIDMNKDEKLPYDYVNFETFIKEFEKYQDDPRLDFSRPGSIFLRTSYFNDILYLHADIVRIDNKCMIFYPIDYLKYKIWMKKIHKERDIHRVKGLWNGGED